MKLFRVALGSLLFVLAAFMSTGQQAGLTGAVTGMLPSGSVSLFSIVVALVAGVIFSAGLDDRVIVKSAIKKDKTLVKLAEEASGSQRAQIGMDHLVKELEKGHAPARIRHLKGTDVFYVGNDEARVYYRLMKGGYEVVAKSRKGENQDKVIKKLEDIYKK